MWGSYAELKLAKLTELKFSEKLGEIIEIWVQRMNTTFFVPRRFFLPWLFVTYSYHSGGCSYRIKIDYGNRRMF